MLYKSGKKTKIQILISDISSKILHGEYRIGDKLPSEREMADSASVSRDTVRQAYMALEKTGLLKRVQGSGTHISTELRGHSSAPQAVALVCPGIDSFGVEFVATLESALAERNTLMVLKINKTPKDDDKVMLELMQRGIKDIIIWPSGYTELSSVCARLRALGANIVFFDRVLPNKYADFVGLDNNDAITKLLEHAKSKHAQAYTFLCLADIRGDSTDSRKDVFIQWCEAKGVEYDIFQSDAGGDDGVCLGEMLGKHGDDTKRRAYICVNDFTALKLKENAPHLDLVYGIDGIVAKDDKIVTILQPFEDMANKSVELLFQQQRLGDTWKAKEILYKGELID